MQCCQRLTSAAAFLSKKTMLPTGANAMLPKRAPPTRYTLWGPVLKQLSNYSHMRQNFKCLCGCNVFLLPHKDQHNEKNVVHKPARQIEHCHLFAVVVRTKSSSFACVSSRLQ